MFAVTFAYLGAKEKHAVCHFPSFASSMNYPLQSCDRPVFFQAAPRGCGLRKTKPASPISAPLTP